MRRLIVTLAAVFALCPAGSAGVGVSVNININRPAGAPEGYEATCSDDDMFREDLCVINAGCIGFWAVLPTGERVLHCRNMWYDRKSHDWFYGPWREDRTVRYAAYRRGPFNNVRFHDYMHQNYPRYYERRFHQEMIERQKRHEKPMERERAIDREKTIDRERHPVQEQKAPGGFGRAIKDEHDKNIGRKDEEKEDHRDEGNDNRDNQDHERDRR